MFSSTLNKLPERFPHIGPWLVSLVLAALIAAELARAALSFVHAPPTAAQFEPQRLSASAPRRGVDVEQIVAAHLFGTIEADPGTQELRATAARLVLDGTIATDDPKRGVAIIRGDDSPSKVYSVGQNVAGALLHAVYLDHVVLSRNGALETLALLKLVADARSTAAGHSRPSPGPDVAQVAQPAPAPDESQARTDVVQLAQTGIAGMHGFRVVGGKDYDAFRAAGLRPNDVVTAVNGAPLQDQVSAQRSMNDLQSGHATVTVMRGGHPVNVNVNFDQ